MENTKLVMECQNVSKKFGKKTALKDFTLKLEKGHIVGLLGANGAGKTTLLKLCAGLLTPDSGKIQILGDEIGGVTKAKVSFLPDMEFLPDWMQLQALVKMYAEFFADFNERKAIEMLNLLQLDLKSTFKKLSKGNKEKVQLILAMSRSAQLYLLDEPIGGVDPAAREYILNTIIGNYSENSTVVISTHLILDVESILDEAIFIKEGELILHKAVEDIRLEQNMSLDAYFREVFKCY